MNHLSLFEEKQVRRAWNAEQEKWLFAIVDVVAILTNSTNPQTYWRVMKKRLMDEGNKTVTNCNGLKMTAVDGKQRMTDSTSNNKAANESPQKKTSKHFPNLQNGSLAKNLHRKGHHQSRTTAFSKSRVPSRI